MEYTWISLWGWRTARKMAKMVGSENSVKFTFRLSTWKRKLPIMGYKFAKFTKVDGKDSENSVKFIYRLSTWKKIVCMFMQMFMKFKMFKMIKSSIFLNPNLSCLWIKRNFKTPEMSPGWLSKIFIKKMPRKISLQTFLFHGLPISQCHFQWAFDDNVSVIHVFIKQIFRAALKVPTHPPPPFPPQSCAGGGVVWWLFSALKQ
jgi:hypothetical protein